MRVDGLRPSDRHRLEGRHPPSLHDALHSIHALVRVRNDVSWSEGIQRKGISGKNTMGGQMATWLLS